MLPRAVLALIALAGCDTLGARRAAQEAVELYKAGKLEAALARFDAAIASDPSIPTLHLDRGFTCLRLHKGAVGEARERAASCAIESFRRFGELSPSDTRARDYLLQTFADTLRYDDALAYFEPELARTPPSSEAMSLLGQIAAKQGKLELAEEWCRKRAEATPKDPAAHQCLGTLAWEHLHRHPELTGEARLSLADAGIAALARASELAPELPDPYSFANLLYRERALAHCPGASMIAKTDAELAELKACEEARQRDLAEADRLRALAKKARGG